MSTMSESKSYAVEVAESALNAFEKQARGTLEAPNGDENVRLYTAKGGSAVTLASTTTSASIVFDPEASLRNGQLNVQIYERDSSDAVTGQQVVNLGRATNEFLSAGVLSSGLKVFNSSGVDVIGGTQSAAVLTSIPRDVSVVTSTTLANSCANHDRDLASGVVSREDSTMTMAMTEHFGKKMALSRANTLSNTVERSWDDGIGARRVTSGQTLGFTTNTDLAVGTANQTPAEVLAGATKFVMDTDRLDESNKPLTLATYAVTADIFVQFTDNTVTNAGQTYDGIFIATDSAGNIVGSVSSKQRQDVISGVDFNLSFSGSITSDSKPIARVVFAIEKTGFADTDTVIAANSYSHIRAFEETADIAARPIHVCVLEGLNASATININSCAVLTGVPDSTNVFISPTGSDPSVYDMNAVEMFLKSISRALPRAFTISGHRAVSHAVTAVYAGEEVAMSFKAMSFKPIVSTLQRAGKMSKVIAKDLPEALKEAKEIAHMAGKGMSMMPGSIGLAGDALARATR